jgi:hypothetical protein
MNWRRGFFRIWLALAVIWVAVVLVGATQIDTVVLRKPDAIVIKYLGEDIRFPATMSVDEIRSDLQSRAAKWNADGDAKLEKAKQLIAQRKASGEVFDEDLELGRVILTSRVADIPTEWEEQFRSRDLREEAGHLAPWLLGPPALLLLIGWVVGWVVRGFLAAGN